MRGEGSGGVLAQQVPKADHPRTACCWLYGGGEALLQVDAS